MPCAPAFAEQEVDTVEMEFLLLGCISGQTLRYKRTYLGNMALPRIQRSLLDGRRPKRDMQTGRSFSPHYFLAARKAHGERGFDLQGKSGEGALCRRSCNMICQPLC